MHAGSQAALLSYIHHVGLLCTPRSHDTQLWGIRRGYPIGGGRFSKCAGSGPVCEWQPINKRQPRILQPGLPSLNLARRKGVYRLKTVSTCHMSLTSYNRERMLAFTVAMQTALLPIFVITIYNHRNHCFHLPLIPVTGCLSCWHLAVSNCLAACQQLSVHTKRDNLLLSSVLCVACAV